MKLPVFHHFFFYLQKQLFHGIQPNKYSYTQLWLFIYHDTTTEGNHSLSLFPAWTFESAVWLWKNDLISPHFFIYEMEIMIVSSLWS